VNHVAIVPFNPSLSLSAMLRTLTRLAPVLARPAAASSSLARSVVPSLTLRRSMAVHAVKDDAELRSLLEKSGEKLVIVDWTAAWCGPCKQIAPVYESLSNENKNVVFIKADIDTLQDASVEAGVQSVPTFHFIKNNELVAEFSGADQNKLKTLIKQHA
jgi:thioredoxin 1